VDLRVQFAPGEKTYNHFLALSELLEARLGRKVELVSTEALSVLRALDIGGSGRCASSRVITFSTYWLRRIT
jgi:hypothetical protein